VELEGTSIRTISSTRWPSFDNAGNLYGTTFAGGTNDTGTIYELTNTSDGWTETILRSFNASTDGSNPAGGVDFDQQGNLYGTASAGGPGNCGTVYQLQLSGGGWTFNLLHGFGGFGEPFDTLTLDAAGNLYATSIDGGSNGTGNVFKLTNGSQGWTYTDLYDFKGDLSDGYAPIAGVVLDGSGNLYGTTPVGGNQNRNCNDGGCV